MFKIHKKGIVIKKDKITRITPIIIRSQQNWRKNTNTHNKLQYFVEL